MPQRKPNVFLRKWEYEICTVCFQLLAVSDSLSRSAFFAVNTSGTGLPLPFGRGLTAHDESSLRRIMENEDHLRTYSKNAQYTGERLAYRLWVGDYSATEELAELVQWKGIKRLGVLRPDVDNLGQAIVNGFSETGGGRYETITRTSVLSRCRVHRSSETAERKHH